MQNQQYHEGMILEMPCIACRMPVGSGSVLTSSGAGGPAAGPALDAHAAAERPETVQRETHSLGCLWRRQMHQLIQLLLHAALLQLLVEGGGAGGVTQPRAALAGAPLAAAAPASAPLAAPRLAGASLAAAGLAAGTASLL